MWWWWCCFGLGVVVVLLWVGLGLFWGGDGVMLVGRRWYGRGVVWWSNTSHYDRKTG